MWGLGFWGLGFRRFRVQDVGFKHVGLASTQALGFRTPGVLVFGACEAQVLV